MQLSVDKVPSALGCCATVAYATMSQKNKGVLQKMTIADRIQSLRKSKGISQEELADKLGVSRQAVSKWESEQSTPELDKVISMSQFFDVTTDYLLKGTETAEQKEKKNEKTGQILYLASVFFLLIGLLCAFGSWIAEQSAEGIWGSMIIQAVGIAAFFVGKIMSQSKPHYLTIWLDVLLILFLPLSMLITFCFNRILSPYPTDLASGLVFAGVYLAVAVVLFFILKKQNKSVK